MKDRVMGSASDMFREGSVEIGKLPLYFAELQGYSETLADILTHTKEMKFANIDNPYLERVGVDKEKLANLTKTACETIGQPNLVESTFRTVVRMWKEQNNISDKEEYKVLFKIKEQCNEYSIAKHNEEIMQGRNFSIINGSYLFANENTGEHIACIKKDDRYSIVLSNGTSWEENKGPIPVVVVSIYDNQENQWVFDGNQWGSYGQIFKLTDDFNKSKYNVYDNEKKLLRDVEQKIGVQERIDNYEKGVEFAE